MTEQQELTVQQETQQAPAQKKITPAQAFCGIVDGFEKFMSKKVKQNSELGGKIKQAFYVALTKAPELAECTPESIKAAIGECYATGLVPDRRNAALVSYRDNRKGVTEMSLQPMYQGWLEAAYSSEIVKDVNPVLVYEGDDYEFANGGLVNHSYDPFDNKRLSRPMVGVYAIAKLVTGGEVIVTMSTDEIDKVRNVAKTDKIWSAWTEQMVKKSALIRLCKLLPKNERIGRLFDLEESHSNFSSQRNVTPSQDLLS